MKDKYQIQREILNFAIQHFTKIIDTLTGIEKLNQVSLGLEGWFRIELAKTIEHTDYLLKIRNKGADLQLVNNEFIELKAAADLNLNYILPGTKKQSCLFLGKPRGRLLNSNKHIIELEIKKKTNAQFEIIHLKNNWYIGLIYN